MLVLSLASPAFAECTPDPTPAFGTVTCTGTDADGLVVDTNQTIVNVEDNATVSSVLTTTRITAANPFDNFNFITLNVDGAITNGVTVDSGTREAGIFSTPNTNTTLVVGETGSVKGTTAIRLTSDPSISFGNAIINITNSGIIESTTGPAILATDLDREGVSYLLNQTGGKIGGIHANIGSLDNRGMIDGGNDSAIRYVTDSSPAVSPSNFMNSGTIQSNSAAATFEIQSPDFYFLSGTNSGTIANSGAGNAISFALAPLSNGSVTNSEDGIIRSDNGIAIVSNGSLNIQNEGEITGATIAIRSNERLTLTNRGVINGDVIAGINPSSTGSFIDTSGGGIINGSIILGAGDDTVITDFETADNLFTNVTGTVDAGGGTNTLQVNFGADTALTEALITPADFQLLTFDIANEATLTLEESYSTSAAIAFSQNFGSFGGGELVNKGTFSTNGTAIVSPSYTLSKFTNEGDITATLANPFDIAVRIDQTEFVNTGNIVGNGGGGLDSSGNLTNSGSIVADGVAVRIFQGVVENSGLIQSNDAIGLSLSGNVGVPAANSGTIIGNLAGAQVAGHILTNTGTISGTETGVALDPYGTLDNQVRGVVNGGVSTLLYGFTFNATVKNAGTINGDVNFGDFPGNSNNVFVAQPGGIVNGNVHLGSGGDLFVTSLVNDGPGEFAGVTGTVTGGSNSRLRYLVDQDTDADISLSGIFSGVGYDLSNNAQLTLTGSSPTVSAIQFVGTGSVDITTDITSDIGVGILNIGVEQSVQVTGNPPTAVPNNLNVVSHGTLTITNNDPFQFTSAAVVVSGGSSFTNNGTIIVNDMMPNSFVGSQKSGISGVSGEVINNGTISVGGGRAIESGALFGVVDLTVTNNGTIEQLAGAIDGVGVSGVNMLTNNGTIRTGGTAVFVNTPNSIGGTVVNAGIIESINGIAILSASGSSFFPPAAVSNLEGGVVSGGAGQLAIGLVAGSSLDNAGTINGNVNLDVNDSFRNDGSTYFSRGGTLNGSLTFGSGNDVFISVGPDSGVTGTIDAGDGIDTYTAAYTETTNILLGDAVIPDSFEKAGIGALGQDTEVTVTGPVGGVDTGISFVGDGKIINQADFNGSSSFFNGLGTGTITLAVAPGAASGQKGLAFVNEANLADGVTGVASSFENSGTVGRAGLPIYAVRLTAKATDTFQFGNSGTISGTESSFSSIGVFVDTDDSQSTMQNAIVTNEGEIRTHAVFNLVADDISFENSGLITQAQNFTPSFFSSPLLQIRAGDSFSFDGSFDKVSENVSIINSGTIEGSVSINAAATKTVFVNSGVVTGNPIFQNGVEVFANGLNGPISEGVGFGTFDQESFDISNSGDMAGRLVVGGRVANTVVNNSGTIQIEQSENSGFFAPISPALIVSTGAANDLVQEVTNSGDVITSGIGSDAIFLGAAAFVETGVSKDTEPTAAIAFTNSGTVVASGGAIFTTAEPIFPDSRTVVTTSSAIVAVATSTDDSSVSITNLADGLISTTGIPRSSAPDYEPQAGFAAGDGSVAIVASATQVVIDNSGTITGGSGIQLSPESFVDVGADTFDADTMLSNRYLAGAILTFNSADEVNNSGTINGSIDLGAFDDVLENRGTINGDIFLRDGDDVFVQGATGMVNGVVDGGLGADTLDIDSTGSTGEGFDLEQFINFETVAISGTGTIGLSGDLQFETVMLNGGSLEIAERESLSTTGTVAITGGTRSEMVTNRGTISGAVVLGDGDDTLSNFGTIIGPVDLGAGDDTFTLTNDSITASVSGGAGDDILALTFAGTEEAPDSLDLVNFSDFETLQQNSGFIRISDQLSFANINLIGGRLIGEAGSIITSDVITVASGATFGSAGTVNADIVVNGTLSPGASPGTMMVAGDVDFGSGSTTVFEITPTVSDQLIVTGAISVADGAVLNLTGNRPLTPGAPLNLVTSTDGITGSFTVNKAQEIFGFIRQQANAIQLIGLFPVDSGFSSQVATTVEYTNGVLQSGVASSALIDALPQLTTSAGATNAAAFGQLSPEAYASAGQIGIENGLAISKSLRGDQLNPSTDEAGLFTFANGFGNWRRLAGNASIGTSRANIRNSGVVGGIGFGSEKGSISALIGFVDARQSIGALGTTTEADGIVLGAVGNIVVDRFRGSASLIFDGSSADTDRTLPGNTSVTSDYKMRGWTVDISATYAMPVADTWLVEPQLGITHISSRRAGVNENSISPFNLDIAGQRYRGTFIDAAFALRGGQKNGAAIRPWISAGVRHQLNNGVTSATAGFSGVATNFTISGAERRDTLLTLGAGIEADIGKSTTIFAGYNGEFGSGSGGNQAQVGIRIGF